MAAWRDEHEGCPVTHELENQQHLPGKRESSMTSLIQPSNDAKATLYAIAWSIVQPYVSANSAAFSPEETGSLLFYTVASMTDNPDPRMTSNPAPHMRAEQGSNARPGG